MAKVTNDVEAEDRGDPMDTSVLTDPEAGHTTISMSRTPSEDESESSAAGVSTNPDVEAIVTIPTRTVVLCMGLWTLALITIAARAMFPVDTPSPVVFVDYPDDHPSIARLESLERSFDIFSRVADEGRIDALVKRIEMLNEDVVKAGTAVKSYKMRADEAEDSARRIQDAIEGALRDVRKSLPPEVVGNE